MLNELYQVVTALERRGTSIAARHPSVDPMGKNADLLLVSLSLQAKPMSFSVIRGEQAGTFLRVKHGSEGSSFPGFNVPLPLRQLPELPNAGCVQKLEALVGLLRDRKSAAAAIACAARNMFPCTLAIDFTQRQADQFRRSVIELAGWLADDFSTKQTDERLVNFRRLLDCTVKAKLDLNSFTDALAQKLVVAKEEMGRTNWELIIETLYGRLDWKKNSEVLGSPEYQKAKANQDKNLKRAIYLDVTDSDVAQWPVADPRTSELINEHLVRINAPVFTPGTRQRDEDAGKSTRLTTSFTDAFTGHPCEMLPTFPKPKLAVLGNVQLFAVNTNETISFSRYGLEGTATFKTSRMLAEKMQNALLYLANDKQVDKTCRSIPSNRKGKQDLLIAYLEEEPDAPDPFVELFGNEAENCDAADFAASTKVALDALEGRIAANPNQRIRLITITAIDKANKQVNMNRSFTISEVADAAKKWQAGAANCPPVSLPFVDKQAKKPASKDRTVPSPLETAIVLNKVWASNTESGFRQEFQRIISVSDAYDIFLAPDIVRGAKTRFALGILLTRMRDVFAAAGALKATSDFKSLGEPVRWQVLKAVALIGIFLQQQGKKHEVFMKEPIYQVGRLLALADSLHFQYCKYVRTSEEKRKSGKVDAPSELLGNALFNAALDKPVVALARLAERIRPYKGWADTYSGEGAGLVHWFVRRMAECETQINDLSSLPKRMEDEHKAQLLLGYLADNPKSENKE